MPLVWVRSVILIHLKILFLFFFEHMTPFSYNTSLSREIFTMRYIYSPPPIHLLLLEDGNLPRWPWAVNESLWQTRVVFSHEILLSIESQEQMFQEHHENLLSSCHLNINNQALPSMRRSAEHDLFATEFIRKKVCFNFLIF